MMGCYGTQDCIDEALGEGSSLEADDSNCEIQHDLYFMLKVEMTEDEFRAFRDDLASRGELKWEDVDFVRKHMAPSWRGNFAEPEWWDPDKQNNQTLFRGIWSSGGFVHFKYENGHMYGLGYMNDLPPVSAR